MNPDVRALGAAVSILTASLAFGAPSEYVEPWALDPVRHLHERFSTNDHELRWRPVGNPIPEWHAAQAGRQGILDNNGDGDHASGLVSRFLVDAREGLLWEGEFFLEVTNPDGCHLSWSLAVSAGIGEIQDKVPHNPHPEGIQLALAHEGGACWGTPESERFKGWLNWGIREPAGTYASGRLPADDLLNTWVRLSIRAEPNGRVTFRAGTIEWSPDARLDPEVLDYQRVALYGRSAGRSGKAWCDWVRFTSPPPP